MTKRNDLQVIQGGKSGTAETPCEPHLSEGCNRLREKALHYRDLAAGKPDPELSSLVGDMIDAINALELLEQSAETEGRRRAIEYRCLIAELEIEIVAALER